MTKNIYQLEQKITNLEEKVAILVVELQSSYTIYLQQLGESLQKQLVFAAYQVCTQAYPESFLSLSLSQRQNFQQTLRKFAQKAQNKLLSSLEFSNSPLPESENLLEESSPQQDLATQSQINPELTTDDQQVSLNPNLSNPEQNNQITNPEQLIYWIKSLEKNIADTLQAVSNDANKLLLKFQIISPKIPAKVLEAASQVESTASPVAGQPNLLNLLVEGEKKESEENSEVKKITAIYLRLGEIEFTEPSLSLQRNKLREMLIQVKNLSQEYQKINKKLAIAKAEGAWRSSWYED